MWGAVVALLLGACRTGAVAPAPVSDWWAAPVGTPLGPLWPLLETERSGALARPADWVARAPSDPGAAPMLCHPTGARTLYPLDDAPTADFDAGVRVRSDPGGGEAFGMAFDRQGPDGYLLARLNSRTNSVRLYRREGARWALVASRDLAVPVGQWQELNVRARGSRVVVGLNREPLLDVPDAGRPAGRGLALWVMDDTAACFDRLWVAPWPSTRGVDDAGNVKGVDGG